MENFTYIFECFDGGATTTCSFLCVSTTYSQCLRIEVGEEICDKKQASKYVNKFKLGV